MSSFGSFTSILHASAATQMRGGRSNSAINQAVVPPRLAHATRVVETLSAAPGPPPVDLRDARHPVACALEARRGVAARERSGRPGFGNAVSLRVQPQLVLTLREALARASGIKLAFVYGAA